MVFWWSYVPCHLAEYSLRESYFYGGFQPTICIPRGKKWSSLTQWSSVIQPDIWEKKKTANKHHCFGDSLWRCRFLGGASCGSTPRPRCFVTHVWKFTMYVGTVLPEGTGPHGPRAPAETLTEDKTSCHEAWDVWCFRMLVAMSLQCCCNVVAMFHSFVASSAISWWLRWFVLSHNWWLNKFEPTGEVHFQALGQGENGTAVNIPAPIAMPYDGARPVACSPITCRRGRWHLDPWPYESEFPPFLLPTSRSFEEANMHKFASCQTYFAHVAVTKHFFAMAYWAAHNFPRSNRGQLIYHHMSSFHS